MRTAGVAVSVGALLALAACTSGSGPTSHTNSGSPVSHASPVTPGGSGSSSSSSTPPAPALPANITIPKAHRQHVNPRTPIAVNIANGTLTSVKMRNPEGKRVTGALSSDGSSWHTTEPLGYDRTYRIVAKGRNGDGIPTQKHTKFTTVTPSNMTLPYLHTIYGSNIVNNATYGVGMLVAVHFDEVIPDRKAADKALTVTTSPHVDGAWYWTDAQTAHWRPQHFYKPGTKVSVHANVYGRDLGDGLYGQSDESVSFKIGAKHLAVANAKTHQVKVYFHNKMVRKMPTSMGQGGYVQGKYGPIALWTPNGLYTVINFENPAIMSSDSYGLPSTSAYGYPPEKVPWSTKISIDGIYLHELDTTIWAQGHENVSHGCLNLNYDNAHWYFTHSRIGDVVKVIKSGGPPVSLAQGGDWSVPWKTWSKGNL
jgi:lipoprotein-anchoring transpeptidase ErfK/SrfK